MQHCELEVAVPWGHIAIKAWGDPKNDIVLVLHGLLDNAGSFDTLIPRLPRNFYYACVDLPGHGLSSHFPSYLPIHVLNYIFSVRTVMDYFKRDKYILFGHSVGGRIAMLYTQIFPEKISKIAVIDTGYAFPGPPEEFIPSMRFVHDMLNKDVSKGRPTYSYEEIVQKIMKGRLAGILTFEAAEQLAKRIIKKVGNDKYRFTHDQKLKAIVYLPYSKEYIKEMLTKYPIICPALSIYTKGSREAAESQPGLEGFYSIPNFKAVEVEGHHHSHHTNPEVFAPALTEFLLEQRNKL